MRTERGSPSRAEPSHARISARPSAFPRDCHPRCHFSCYRTSVRRPRRCPCAGRGWFTNISGEYNYTAPPHSSPPPPPPSVRPPPAGQPYAGTERGQDGGEWTPERGLQLLLRPGLAHPLQTEQKADVWKRNFSQVGDAMCVLQNKPLTWHNLRAIIQNTTLLILTGAALRVYDRLKPQQQTCLDVLNLMEKSGETSTPMKTN